MTTLLMKRGDTFVCEAPIIGEPVPGALFAFSIRRFAGEPGIPVIKKDNKARGGVTIANKTLTISLNPADTLILPNEHRIYVYEITQQNHNGEFFTLDDGEFQIRASLTH